MARPATPPPKPWTVYLLRCRDGSLYAGITNDLTKRLAAHAAGKASRYTRSRLPVAVAYTEPQPDKSAALKREAAIKRLRRDRKEHLVLGGTDVPLAPAASRGGVRRTDPRAAVRSHRSSRRG